VQYAISLPNGHACGDPASLSEFAALAEASGWDAIVLEDYIVWQGHSDAPTFDPWVALAAMAVKTRTIRLGTLVTPISRRRPWKLARETVSIDQLSGGRLILGIGLGDNMMDTSFNHFGEETDLKRRAEMTDEGLQILTGLWSGEPFHFEGKYYHVKEVTFLPTPVQKPRIPIWIGGAWPLKGPTRRALSYDGACFYKLPPDEEMTPQDVRSLANLAREQRQPGTTFDIFTGHAAWQVNKDPGAERAHIAALAEAGATWWSIYVPPDSEEVMRRYIANGPLRIN
jgi:alkanesulfonate monooxygenase SsuD/methylene tetrahydromethanopterin reductase-like flavin-dependent oxidoreductase (luciferase family)